MPRSSLNICRFTGSSGSLWDSACGGAKLGGRSSAGGSPATAAPAEAIAAIVGRMNGRTGIAVKLPQAAAALTPPRLKSFTPFMVPRKHC